MSKCCGGGQPAEIKAANPYLFTQAMTDCSGAGGAPAKDSICSGAKPSVCAAGAPVERAVPDSLAWFRKMIPNCLAHARAQKAAGRPVVGILCEYTPREIIMAAGAVPVCLCGGSAETIPAAEEVLPANLCPLIKSTFGYVKEKSNPFLEMADLVVAETTCDGKKKMYELMAESKPMVVLELPQRQNETAALAYWESELRRLKGELERRFGVEITDCRLREAIGVMNRERSLRRRLAELMKADAPPLTGHELLDLKSSISGIEEDLVQYERAHDELAARVPDAAMASRPRVLLTGAPTVHGAERVLEIIEGSGGLVVCQENCTGLKPIVDDVDERADDPIRALAEKYYHIPCSVMTRNEWRMDSLRHLAAKYRADCVMELVWQACLTYDVESHRVKCLAEEELGIPYLRIQTDYSPSDSARIAVRVEALFETLKNRRGQ